MHISEHFYDIKHVAYGTDAPFGIIPNGTTKEIEEVIDVLPISKEDRKKIYYDNIMGLVRKTKSV